MTRTAATYRCVEDVVEGNGKLHNTKRRSQMTTSLGHSVNQVCNIRQNKWFGYVWVCKDLKQRNVKKECRLAEQRRDCDLPARSSLQSCLSWRVLKFLICTGKLTVSRRGVGGPWACQSFSSSVEIVSHEFSAEAAMRPTVFLEARVWETEVLKTLREPNTPAWFNQESC